MDPWNSLKSLSSADVAHLQNQQLHAFITTHVYPFSPFYRRLFDQKGINPNDIKTIADLKRIPFVSKTDFINPNNPQQYRDFILQPDEKLIKQFWPKGKLIALLAKKIFNGSESVKDAMNREYRPIFMTFTTGTTNSPVPFVYSRHDIDNLNISGSRMVRLFDIAEDERIMNIFPFAPHLAFWQVFFGAVQANVFALSTGGGKVLGTEGNMTAMMRIKPSVILGVPSYIYHLIRFAQQKNHDLSFIKKIVLGAAKVTVAYKQKLADMLKEQGATDVKIFGTYGFTEARSAWAECPAQHHESSGYHLYPDKEIIEIIDPETGEVKGPGEDGEIVYTSLDARASVVLRYRTGDFVKGGVTYGECPFCKRVCMRLSSDISRLSDTKDLQLSKVKGTLVNLSHFGSVLNDMLEIEEWQIEIRKHNNDPFDVDEVIIYVTPRKDVNESTLLVAIKEKVVGSTEVSPNEIITIPLCDMIKRLELETANKEKRILDLRPKG